MSLAHCGGWESSHWRNKCLPFLSPPIVSPHHLFSICYCLSGWEVLQAYHLSLGGRGTILVISHNWRVEIRREEGPSVRGVEEDLFVGGGVARGLLVFHCRE